MKLPHDKLLRDIPATSNPTMPRGSFLRALVDQVNRNTIALAPPRAVSNGTLEVEAVDGTVTIDDQFYLENALLGSVVWNEIYRQTETVRVENPEDSEQYVDVDRFVTSIMASSDGRIMSLKFDNSLG